MENSIKSTNVTNVTVITFDNSTKIKLDSSEIYKSFSKNDDSVWSTTNLTEGHNIKLIRSDRIPKIGDMWCNKK